MILEARRRYVDFFVIRVDWVWLSAATCSGVEQALVGVRLLAGRRRVRGGDRGVRHRKREKLLGEEMAKGERLRPFMACDGGAYVMHER